MSNSLFKKFGRIPSFCDPLFGLLFVASLISCAGNGKPLTESDPQSEGSQAANSGSYTDDYFDESSTVNSDASTKSARRNTANSFSSDGFSFILPQGGAGHACCMCYFNNRTDCSGYPEWDVTEP